MKYFSPFGLTNEDMVVLCDDSSANTHIENSSRWNIVFERYIRRITSAVYYCDEQQPRLQRHHTSFVWIWKSSPTFIGPKILNRIFLPNTPRALAFNLSMLLRPRKAQGVCRHRREVYAKTIVTLLHLISRLHLISKLPFVGNHEPNKLIHYVR